MTFKLKNSLEATYNHSIILLKKIKIATLAIAKWLSLTCGSYDACLPTDPQLILPAGQ